MGSEYVVLFVWFLLLRITILRFTPSVMYVTGCFLLIAEWQSLVSIFYSLPFYLLMNIWTISHFWLLIYI
jgi:hypothetical protein